MGYSATSPTRSARTAREVKAIVRDLTFGLYDRSVYQQQGRRFGDLTAKDMTDINTSIMRHWQDLFYNGDINADALEFDGLKVLLGAGDSVVATASIVKAIQTKVVAMMNTSARDVMPTDVLVNARVRQLIAQEYAKSGDKQPYLTGPKGERVASIDTAAGDLPLRVDAFNGVTAGTPDVYTTLIMSMDKVSWQYVEPLGQAGADPKVFELVSTTGLDTQFKGLMFGALELLGGTNHHARLNVENRTTVVDPTT